MKARALCALTAGFALGLSAIGATPAHAETGVDIPDHDLRLCITRALDLAPDAPLTDALLAGMGNLSCDDSSNSDLRISSLAGIEHLAKVQLVRIGAGHVTDLTPLAGLSSLRWLAIRDNEVSDLSALDGLNTLYSLDVAGNPVTTLEPLLALPALSTLDVHGTALTDLATVIRLPHLGNLTVGDLPSIDYSPLAGLDALAYLAVDDGAITSLDSIPIPAHLRTFELRAPRVSTLRGLERATGLLRLYSGEDLVNDNGALSDISALSGLSELIQVHLVHGAIANISALANKPELVELYVGENQISDLAPLATDTSLRSLWLDLNSVGDLSPLSGLTALTELRANVNRIRDLSPLSGLASLQQLDLSRNLISDVTPLSGLSQLKELQLYGNRIRDISPLVSVARLVHARDQQLTASDPAVVGVASPLGIRDVNGHPVCATNPNPGVSCADGAMTYPASGTYTSTFSGEGISGSITQSVGPDRAFTRTYTPTVDGVPTVGLSVVAVVRNWSPKADRFTYRWYRDGRAIPGDAASDYYYNAVGADHGARLSVCVTGHLDGYADTTRCSSRARATLTGEISFPTRPKVAGSAATGVTLTAIASTYNAEVRLIYQWQRNGHSIRGATGVTYAVKASDVGDHLRVKVRGTAAGYHSHTEYSKSVTAHKALLVPVVPTVTGDATVGATLSADAGTWEPAPVRLAYQWYADGRALAKQTRATHVVSGAERGKAITVTVTATKPGYYTSRRTSVPTAAVVAG